MRKGMVKGALAVILASPVLAGAQRPADPVALVVSAETAEAFQRRPGVIVFRARAQLQSLRVLVFRSPRDGQGNCTFESQSSDPGDLPDGMEYIEEQIATDPNRCETLHQAGFRSMGRR